MKNKNYIVVFLSFFLIVFLLLGLEIVIFKGPGLDDYGGDGEPDKTFLEKEIEKFKKLKKEFEQIKKISGTDSNTFKLDKIPSYWNDEKNKILSSLTQI